MKARPCAAALAGLLAATACSQGADPLQPGAEGPAIVASASGVSPAAVVEVDVQDFSFAPVGVAVPQGQSVSWSFHGPSIHTATDKSGMGLFDSDFKEPGQSFAFQFQAAGKYQYRCLLHGIMIGHVRVAIKVTPRTGSVRRNYTVKWAAAAPPAGFVSDIQILRPGAADYVDWRTGQTALKATFVPDSGPGDYSFRARLRNTANGKKNAYSAPRTLTAG